MRERLVNYSQKIHSLKQTYPSLCVSKKMNNLRNIFLKIIACSVTKMNKRKIFHHSRKYLDINYCQYNQLIISNNTNDHFQENIFKLFIFCEINEASSYLFKLSQTQKVLFFV